QFPRLMEIPKRVRVSGARKQLKRRVAFRSSRQMDLGGRQFQWLTRCGRHARPALRESGSRQAAGKQAQPETAHFRRKSHPVTLPSCRPNSLAAIAAVPTIAATAHTTTIAAPSPIAGAAVARTSVARGYAGPTHGADGCRE